MAKYSAGIQYDGTSYCGWQRQSSVTTVQQVVETAISKIANEPITIFCSGRTDTGVHAIEQIIHFESKAIRDDYAWRMGCNSSMPKDVRLMWCHTTADDFHARFSATARKYQYVIHNARTQSALIRDRVCWISQKLNEHDMHQAAQFLLGENDFSGFRASGCQAKTPYRHVHNISVDKKNDFVIVTITANAFLHHMVRNIVGSLIEVGKGRQKPQWIAHLLAEKNRTKAAATALACGLYFVKVSYPKKYNLGQSQFSIDDLL